MSLSSSKSLLFLQDSQLFVSLYHFFKRNYCLHIETICFNTNKNHLFVESEFSFITTVLFMPVVHEKRLKLPNSSEEEEQEPFVALRREISI